MATVKAVVEQILEDTLGLGHLLKKPDNGLGHHDTPM
jgi:hypothetical protein